MAALAGAGVPARLPRDAVILKGPCPTAGGNSPPATGAVVCVQFLLRMRQRQLCD